MWPSTQRIGKEIKASLLFTRRAADVISEVFFAATTGDRDNELAAMDLSIAVALISFLFLHLFFKHETIYAKRV